MATNLTEAVVPPFVTAVSAITMATLGVEPQALLYSGAGAAVGTIVAPDVGRVRSIVIFASVVLLCAGAGTLLADLYFNSGQHARNVIGGGLAAIFHPLFAVVVQKLADWADGLMKRLGLKA